MMAGAVNNCRCWTVLTGFGTKLDIFDKVAVLRGREERFLKVS